MIGITRRKLLQVIVAAAGGTAATAVTGQAFTSPLPTRRYQKYGGHNFYPISTFTSDGRRIDWTYNDNGSVYATGSSGSTAFNTRLQLPDGAIIEEVQFNYFLGSPPGMDFSLIAFDNANGYQANIPTAHVESPDTVNIQSVSLTGLPVRVDNSQWNYVLRWMPHGAATDRILWGARVGYRLSENGQ